MSTRKIKDAVDLTTGQKVYVKGHAKATYMSTGINVETAIESKQDTLISGENIKTINGQTLLGSGNITIEAGGEEGISILPMINVTYAELKALRDNSELVPGQQYRITDYETKTAQSGTTSAGHTFDVIVTALDDHTLSENASAVRRENDTYFETENLEAWQLKYCLDNDTTKFRFADPNGKGVIYRMIDEYNNKTETFFQSKGK